MNKQQPPPDSQLRYRDCKNCGRRFVQKESSTAKYCSHGCRANSRSLNPAKGYKHGRLLTKSGVYEYFDSSLEEQAMLMCEAKGLSWTKSHGIKIQYWNPSLRRQAFYIPDFLVRTPAGYKLIELKPYGLINTPVNQAKFTAARDWCKANGYQFFVATSPNQVE